MKKNFLKTYASLAAATVLIAVGCSKDDNNNGGSTEISATDVQTVMDAEQYASIADDAITEAMADPEAGKQGSFTGKDVSCYTGVYTDNGYTLTFADCEMGGENAINGTIGVTYEMLSETSIKLVATFTDFSVGDISMEGSRTFTMDFADENIVMATSSDLVIDTADHHIVFKGGQSTQFSFSAEGFSLTGSWTVKVDKDTYGVTVVDPLHGSAECTYFTSGTAELSKNGLEVTLDYGDGDCDDAATITYPDGTEAPITLHD